MTDNHPTNSTTIRPAAAWPTFEADHARAELEAMKLLCARVPMRNVTVRTGLRMAHVRWLAKLVAEDATTPAPRNVLRHPRRPRAARIRVIDLSGQPPLPQAGQPGGGEQLALGPEADDGASAQRAAGSHQP
ncbi:hypothetical protein ACIG3E_33095 [Streptomyces sp. NPDC053474]|uniref:hypothetical protein n=1 Tax=Streptomyces sp. NPDC053474 TaxID=3365704 RepID=UPI0037CD86EF